MVHPGRVRFNELRAQLRPARAEVALTRRFRELVGGQNRNDHVVFERVALGKHLAERVEDHRQSGFDGVVVNADRIAEDGVDPVLPGPRRQSAPWSTCLRGATSTGWEPPCSAC